MSTETCVLTITTDGGATAHKCTRPIRAGKWCARHITLLSGSVKGHAILRRHGVAPDGERL
jgi:hypothetical protein